MHVRSDRMGVRFIVVVRLQGLYVEDTANDAIRGMT
jgi:hypothetical protein